MCRVQDQALKFEIGGKKETFEVIDTQVWVNKATLKGQKLVGGMWVVGSALGALDCSSLVLLEHSEEALAVQVLNLWYCLPGLASNLDLIYVVVEDNFIRYRYRWTGELPRSAQSVLKGLYLSAEFLAKNDFVENFEEYCFGSPVVEDVEHSKLRNDSVCEYLENIDGEDEWEVKDIKDWKCMREKCEDNVKEESKSENLGNNFRGSAEESEEEMEVLREDKEEEETYKTCESSEIVRLGDISIEVKVVE